MPRPEEQPNSAAVPDDEDRWQLRPSRQLEDETRWDAVPAQECEPTALAYAESAVRTLSPKACAEVGEFVLRIVDAEPVRSRQGWEPAYLMLFNLALDLLERGARTIEAREALAAQRRFDSAMARIRQQRDDLGVTPSQSLRFR
jgi:hypothetical protein